MTEYSYRIAGQMVVLRQDWDEPPAAFSPFSCAVGSPDFTAELYRKMQPGRAWYGLEYRCAQPKIGHVLTSPRFPSVRLDADADWTHAVIEGCEGAQDGVMEVFLAAFYSLFARRGGLLAHASLVRYRDESVLFTAASGVGKTTQAELWRDFAGAEILNGDKALLTVEDGRCTAWGCPWRGSSPYVGNAHAPLKAVVVLEQAGENRIARLGEAQAMTQFFPHVFFPSWDRRSTEGVTASLDTVLRSVPVYLLSCRPDKEAVECTRAALWGEEKR